jgi:hypothetical protein
MTPGDPWQSGARPARTASGCASFVACACLLGCGEVPDLPQPIERTSTTTRSTPAVTVENGLIPPYARDVSIDPTVHPVLPPAAAPARDPSSVDPDELIGSVTLALADSDANARADAVSALGSLHDNPEAAALAHAALSDADPTVREEAAYALGEIGGEMSLYALTPALRDRNDDVKEAAIRALETIGGDQAMLVLDAMLDDPDPRLRAAAIDALREIKGDAAR